MFARVSTRTTPALWPVLSPWRHRPASETMSETPQTTGDDFRQCRDDSQVAIEQRIDPTANATYRMRRLAARNAQEEAMADWCDCGAVICACPAMTYSFFFEGPGGAFDLAFEPFLEVLHHDDTSPPYCLHHPPHTVYSQYWRSCYKVFLVLTFSIVGVTSWILYRSDPNGSGVAGCLAFETVRHHPDPPPPSPDAQAEYVMGVMFLMFPTLCLLTLALWAGRGVVLAAQPIGTATVHAARDVRNRCCVPKGKGLDEEQQPMMAPTCTEATPGAYGTAGTTRRHRDAAV